MQWPEIFSQYSNCSRLERGSWSVPLVVQRLDMCQTTRAMPERDFTILRYVGKLPAMASCTKCQHKFFTPDSYYGDAIGAQEYLFGKFKAHHCEASTGRLTTPHK